jgi:hypothetical protein
LGGLSHPEEPGGDILQVFEVVIPDDHVLDSIVEEGNREVDVVDGGNGSVVDECVVLNGRQCVAWNWTRELFMLNTERDLGVDPYYVDEPIVGEAYVAVVLGID